jgi:hypothetical protein
VHADGVCHIGDVPEDLAITRPYTWAFLKHTGQSKKRKREAGADTNPSLVEQSKCDTESSPKAIKEGEGADDDNPSSTAGEALASTELSISDAKSVNTKIGDNEQEQLELEPGEADDYGNYFYLVKPHTSGARKVLIPLSPTDCLQQCLRDQTVLEFPTVQILPHPPNALPSHFVLEVDYLNKFDEQRDKMQRLVAEIDIPNVEQKKVDLDPSAVASIPNASDILATLEKDIEHSSR